MLIILHFSPEHTQSAHYKPHSIDTHCLVHRCALIAQTHTCASESNVALVTSALEGVILGLLARQRGAAQHGHAHTSHLHQQFASSCSPSFWFIYFLNLLSFYLTTHLFPKHASLDLDLLLVYLFFLFLETELVQDFHSWLADLKLELKECFNQSGDVAILAAKLQRLKVLLYIMFYTISLMLQGVRALWHWIFRSFQFSLTSLVDSGMQQNFDHHNTKCIFY